jgi:AcrR family transcriptional regulator
MQEIVKPQSRLREARKADTERKILDAAAALFVRDGYTATTLAAVAEESGVAARTVYVRFGTKAELLRRVLDVAIVGDTDAVDLAHRDWQRLARTAATIESRLDAYCDGVCGLMERVAPLMAVFSQAEASEPVIAAAAQSNREATVANITALWRAMASDGLLHPDCDVDWAIATTSQLSGAESYIYMSRTLRWDIATYRRWLYDTWLHFATTPGPSH